MGPPRDAGQSIHAGNMNTLPAVVMANRHYKRYLGHIRGSIQLVWVDDVWPSRSPARWTRPLKRPSHAGPLTHDWTIHIIGNPLSKMQWWCSDPVVTITRPTKERLQERMGRLWVTDSAAQRAYIVEGGDVLTYKDVLKLLGCTMSLRRGPGCMRV